MPQNCTFRKINIISLPQEFWRQTSPHKQCCLKAIDPRFLGCLSNKHNNEIRLETKNTLVLITDKWFKQIATSLSTSTTTLFMCLAGWQL